MKKQILSKDTESASPYRQVVDVDGYKLYFDQPESVGGEDSAPVPHAYLDAAVLACKGMVIRLFAARRGFPLDDVKITLNTDDSQERKGLYAMNFEVELIGDLDDKQRETLLAVAEQCPVGKLLTDNVKVEFNSRLVCRQRRT